MTQVSRRQVLIAMGALALVAGCASEETPEKGAQAGGKDGAMANYGPGTQFKATKPLTFTMLHNIHPFYPAKNDWLFWSELTKRTGVTLSLTLVPLSDYEKKRGLIIGAGDAPLIIPKTYHPQEEQFVASGAILPVSDYLDLMPNFTDKVAKWSLQPNLDTLRQADGRFYLLPGLHQDAWMDYSLAVRTDLLDKHKLAIPTTWDELYTVLKALKAEYPDQYPMTDRWGIPTPGGNLLDIAAFAFGTRGGWGYTPEYWDAASQKFIATAAMPQYRQMLEFLTKLVKEGLLDPESFTQTDDQAKAKFNSGKSFVISTNAQTLVNDYRPTLTKNIPDAKIVKIPVPIGPAGALKNEITRLENGVMISAKAKDRPDFVAMMQFIDWLWYSDEGQMFAKWGVEGTTYTKDAGGAIKLAKDVDMIGLNPGAPKHLQKDFGFGNGIFAYGGTTTLLESTFSEEEKEFQKAMNARKSLPVPPPAPLSEEEREQVTAWLTPLKDYVAQQSLAFILGKRDLAEWDAYAKELDGKNLTAYVDIVNKAHQRYKSAHG